MSGVKIWSLFYSDCGGVNYINNTRVLFNKNKKSTNEETQLQNNSGNAGNSCLFLKVRPSQDS